MKVQDVMSDSPITVTAESTVQEAAAKMKEANVGTLPVCDGRSAWGIVTDRDIALNVVAAGKGSATQVGEICTLSPVTVQSDAEIEEAALLMKLHQIRRLPVVQGDAIKGMVSLGDIALAQQHLGGEALAVISQTPVAVVAGMIA